MVLLERMSCPCSRQSSSHHRRLTQSQISHRLYAQLYVMNTLSDPRAEITKVEGQIFWNSTRQRLRNSSETRAATRTNHEEEGWQQLLPHVSSVIGRFAVRSYQTVPGEALYGGWCDEGKCRAATSQEKDSGEEGKDQDIRKVMWKKGIEMISCWRNGMHHADHEAQHDKTI